MTEFQPELILRALVEHDVAFVMIGGLAAALHGSNLATTDLDITPEQGDENLARLSDALRSFHARIRSDATPDGLPFSHDARSLAQATTWNLTTDFGDLDISFVPSGTRGFADLRRSVVVIDIFGTTVAVASLADIIRSKEAANRPKDAVAVPILRRLLAEIEREQRQRE